MRKVRVSKQTNVIKSDLEIVVAGILQHYMYSTARFYNIGYMWIYVYVNEAFDNDKQLNTYNLQFILLFIIRLH